MPSPSVRVAKANRLLASLPTASLERVLPDLHVKPLHTRQVLQTPGERLAEVVFPVEGVASMVSMGDSGSEVEVATIGCEGMVGLPVFLGGEKAAVEIFIQVPGEGLHMQAATFKNHVERDPTLVRTLLLYTQAMMTQVAQCSACNIHHSIEARCARWLLQTHDRVKGDTFPLTQEFLSLMLGVRRATVTEVAGELQNRKLIRYVRGVIEVRDRKGLEGAACDCYQLINGEYDRLLKRPRKTS
jgi:cAMP-binding proteins - catabolite gene activator and regulatory subunit of cAMP-dependent protein kinases